MEMKKSIKNAYENTKSAANKTIKTISFVNGLSVKNKFSYDFQVKSDKSVFPICRHSFGFNKEFRVMPIILSVMAFLGLMLMFKMPGKKRK